MTPDGRPPADGTPDDARAVGLVARGLLHAVPQTDPPPHLKARVMAIVHASTAERARTPTTARPSPAEAPGGARTSRGTSSWLPLAAAALVAIGLGLYAAQLRMRVDLLDARLAETAARLANAEADVRDARTSLVRAQAETAVLTAPDVTRVDLAGQVTAPSAVARAYWSRTRGLVLSASRLPDLPPDRTYQVWVLTDDAPVSAGLLRPDADGRGAAVFDTPRGVTEPRGVAVSVEPEGGVPAPTGAIVLAGML